MIFKIDIDKRKIDAIKMYMPADEELDKRLSDELSIAVDKLFRKYVPKQVREFCELTAKMDCKKTAKTDNSDNKAGDENE